MYENVPDLQITEVILASNDYQHDWRVLHTFVSNKL